VEGRRESGRVGSFYSGKLGWLQVPSRSLINLCWVLGVGIVPMVIDGGRERDDKLSRLLLMAERF